MRCSIALCLLVLCQCASTHPDAAKSAADSGADELRDPPGQREQPSKAMDPPQGTRTPEPNLKTNLKRAARPEVSAAERIAEVVREVLAGEVEHSGPDDQLTA